MNYEEMLLAVAANALSMLLGLIIIYLACRRLEKRGEQKVQDKVIIHAVHEYDMVEFLTSCELTEEIEKNEFICAGCGRTMTIKEIAYIKPVQSPPTVELYGDECGFKVRSG